MFIAARGIIGIGLAFNITAAPILIMELAFPTQKVNSSLPNYDNLLMVLGSNGQHLQRPLEPWEYCGGLDNLRHLPNNEQLGVANPLHYPSIG